MGEPVAEFEVLLASALWLKGQVATEDIQVSPPRGQELSNEEQQLRLKETLVRVGYRNIKFSHRGPDIVAHDKTRIWKVECKGFSRGARSTVDNNFDRALASVVSYYDEPVEGNGGEGIPDLSTVLSSLSRPNKPVRLVLALPDSTQYHKLLRDRVKPSLRKRLDLWLLIFHPATKSITSYDPNRDF